MLDDKEIRRALSMCTLIKVSKELKIGRHTLYKYMAGKDIKHKFIVRLSEYFESFGVSNSKESKEQNFNKKDIDQ